MSGEGEAEALAWVGVLSSVMGFSNAQSTFARLTDFSNWGLGRSYPEISLFNFGFSK